MTLSTSVNRVKSLMRQSYGYLLLTIFCVLFGAVYEYFSHGVYSGYMVYAFAIPLCGGLLPNMTLFILRVKKLPGRLAVNLYNSGIAALTTGSILRGVLDIYGTTNALLLVYLIAGVLLVISGALSYIIEYAMY